MANPAALLMLGKGKPAPGEDEELEDDLPESKPGMSSALVSAAGALRDALEGGDDKAIASALKTAVRACQAGGYEEEEED
jgi:hypothetical protein